jgi:NAD(P)-dependent dehydrogenase (short-subunit alcohol dehydrogenase family)
MMLQNKIALVTGGGTGIGAAVTQQFIAEGARVCIAGWRVEELDVEGLGIPKDSVILCPGDVSSAEDVQRMVDTTLGIAGKIDILVNNAAMDIFGGVTDLTVEQYRKVLDVNLTGPFLTMHTAIPKMIENGGGSIINMASLGGLRASAGACAYDSAKAGLIMLSQQVALEYGRLGIRCNALCPGATRTTMLEAAIGEVAKMRGIEIDAMMTKFTSPVPLRRMAEPSEIGRICCFLASDDSSFITGSALVADGGSSVVDCSGYALGA